MDFQPRVQGEKLRSVGYRALFGQINRIFTLTQAPYLMSFGPNIVDQEVAIAEGFIQSEKEFKPMVRGSTVNDIAVELEGREYKDVNFFFKQGGNKAAGEEWLGQIRFWDDEGQELTYKFSSDGRIELSKTEDDSKWIAKCIAHDEEKSELLDALIGIKEELYRRKIGEAAISGDS